MSFAHYMNASRFIAEFGLVYGRGTVAIHSPVELVGMLRPDEHDTGLFLTRVGENSEIYTHVFTVEEAVAILAVEHPSHTGPWGHRQSGDEYLREVSCAPPEVSAEDVRTSQPGELFINFDFNVFQWTGTQLLLYLEDDEPLGHVDMLTEGRFEYTSPWARHHGPALVTPQRATTKAPAQDGR